jgi:hypothetical protein
LLTAARERPTASAVCWWVSWNSSIRRCRASGFFERIQVLALDVLDQRHRQRGVVVALAHHARALRAAKPAGRHASGARRR